MLLRLSRLSSGLAAGALLLAWFGPPAQRALCLDIALVTGASAFLLWRLALATARGRAQRADGAAPPPHPLDAPALADALARLEDGIATAPTFESALVAAGDALRGELGAARVRALVVAGGDAVSEVIGGERPLRAPPVAVPADGSALRRALDSGRPAFAWPHALALPVLHEDHVVAMIELQRFEVEVDADARMAFVERAAAALARRAGNLSLAPGEPTRRVVHGAATGRVLRGASLARAFGCVAC